MTTYQKFGLIIASNYPGTAFPLGGCIADAERVRNFLVTQRGFPSTNITTLYDYAMTKEGILRSFDTVVARSHSLAATRQVPAFFLHYSGHGTRVRNSNTRQFNPIDGFNDSDGDEAIVPQDVTRNGLLLDDEINTRLVQRLHPSTQLFVLTDCCNSGSNLDLSYQGLSKVSSAGDVAPNIIHAAACRDSQLAAETAEGGAATIKFLRLMANPPKTVPELRTLLGNLSTSKNKQQPQVSVSKASLVQGELFPWMLSNTTRTRSISNPISRSRTMTITIPQNLLRSLLRLE